MCPPVVPAPGVISVRRTSFQAGSLTEPTGPSASFLSFGIPINEAITEKKTSHIVYSAGTVLLRAQALNREIFALRPFSASVQIPVSESDEIPKRRIAGACG